MDEQLTGPTPGAAAVPEESGLAERLIREEFGAPASVFDETALVPSVATAAADRRRRVGCRRGHPRGIRRAGSCSPGPLAPHRHAGRSGRGGGLAGRARDALTGQRPAAAAGAERARRGPDRRQRTRDRRCHRGANGRPVHHLVDNLSEHAHDTATPERDGADDRDLRLPARDDDADSDADDRCAGPDADHGTATAPPTTTTTSPPTTTTTTKHCILGLIC